MNQANVPRLLCGCAGDYDPVAEDGVAQVVKKLESLVSAPNSSK
jgi:hypothetical protein